MATLKAPIALVLGAALVALFLSACAETGGRVNLNSFRNVRHHSRQFARDQALWLGKGVNMGNSLEATPDENAWGNPIDLGSFKLISAAGFQHVRIPIRWSLESRTALTPPYAVAPAFFARIDEVVSAALQSHLMVIINVHHYNDPGRDLFANPEREAQRFIAMWRQIAEHFKNQSLDLVFELLNEPNGELTPAKWSSLAQQTVAAVRKIDTRHTIMIDAPLWGGIDGLQSLVLPDDDNLIGSFHFYEPMQFTHQGASWLAPVPPKGVLWPNRAPYPTNTVIPPATVLESWLGSWYAQYNDQTGDYSGSATDIPRRFDLAQRWGKANDCPVYLGEFGAYSGSEPEGHDSRIRWTRFVREQAQSRGFSYAYWDFSADFSVFDKKTGAFREELLKAIIG